MIVTKKQTNKKKTKTKKQTTQHDHEVEIIKVTKESKTNSNLHKQSSSLVTQDKKNRSSNNRSQHNKKTSNNSTLSNPRQTDSCPSRSSGLVKDRSDEIWFVGDYSQTPKDQVTKCHQTHTEL